MPMLRLNTVLLNSIIYSVDAFDFMDDLIEALKNYCKLLNSVANYNEFVSQYLRLIISNFSTNEPVIRRHMINVCFIILFKKFFYLF